MAEAHESFVLHPSIVAAALQPDNSQSAMANRLLGDVAMGRCTAYAAGGPALLEIYALDALIAARALDGFSIENLANALRDLRQQLAEVNLYGRLLTEEFEPYRLASASIAVKHSLEIYTAFVVTVAGTKGLPLVLENEPLYDKLRLVALTQPGLRIMRLRDYG